MMTKSELEQFLKEAKELENVTDYFEFLKKHETLRPRYKLASPKQVIRITIESKPAFLHKFRLFFERFPTVDSFVEWDKSQIFKDFCGRERYPYESESKDDYEGRKERYESLLS